MDSKKENLCSALHSIKGIKFGSYKTKTGLDTPIYMDLRMIVTHPKIMKDVAQHMWDIIETNKVEYDIICGVPYTALPIATTISTTKDVPMVMTRKEAKSYGTKKMIEGDYKEGQKCLIIEDVVTSGSSILETVEHLTKAGLKVTDAIVVLDREQGGEQNLKNHDINLHSVLKLSQAIEYLKNKGIIDNTLMSQIDDFLSKNKNVQIKEKPKPIEIKSLSERINYSKHPLVKKLLKMMEIKKSNLCISLDVTSSKELLHLADELGPYVVMIKIHVDILEDYTPDLGPGLKKLAEKHNFLIFEDRKLSDIGTILQRQVTGGCYKILDWADIVTVHPIPGTGVLKALKQAIGEQEKGCLAVAEMSSAGALTTKEYANSVVEMAKQYPDVVLGFICQSKLDHDPGFLRCTPGVNIGESGDALGQQYVLPEEAVAERGADIIIVGRGITAQEDKVAMAKLYQSRCYEAYMNQILS
ncbi:UMPS [Cordylochernes scorpioides]|uniref:Uridine 5'-monophosphate synthase n=1 Tax=Cordylochernes scorpioides TaxID=51811 RepID=A0ABY6K5Z6_9ARAC|nr:UMPS [Cordylochernes scorpioides]